MNGRILTIKKTTILKLSFILNALFFVASCLISFLFIKDYNLWFFTFCIFMGLHQIIRSALFRVDSSCYFGVLLLFIGIFYIYCQGLHIENYISIFMLFAFVFASYFTGHFFDQSFHKILSLSLIFSDIALFFYLLNMISIWIFLAIILASVLLLVCRYIAV